MKSLLLLIVAYMLFLLVACLGALSNAKADEPTLQRYWVQYKGREVEVLGSMNREGKVVWLLGGTNDLAKERPIQPVRKPEPEAMPAWQTHGVSRTVGATKPRYTAPSAEARRFVQEVTEGDSLGKLHVTVIGTADERAQVTNDIKTDHAFDGIRDDLWVQDYDPKDWPVDPKLGFVAGKPSIIVQASKGPTDPKGGRVVHRALDYKEGPSGLAEAIRKADPNYNPERDPGPHKPKPPLSPEPTPSLPFGISAEAGLAILGVLVLIANLPKKAR